MVTESERLIIRQFNLNDAAFIMRLLNEESFLRYIGDKNVRTHENALDYLTNNPLLSYSRYGFGLNLVQLKGAETPIGMCGLLKRAELDFPDLGYAFLPEFCGQGYAKEAAEAVLKDAIENHAVHTVLAVTLPENISSARLLEGIGFRAEGSLDLYGAQNTLYRYSTCAALNGLHK